MIGFLVLFSLFCFIVIVLKKLRRKPLIVLDLNNVICFREYTLDQRRFAHLDHKGTLLGRHMTWIRPGWESARDDLFNRYEVAVWSSCKRENLNLLLDFLFGDYKDKLLFAWDQSECVIDGNSVKRPNQPNLTKPLSKVWERFLAYGPHNTKIVDDSMEKIRCNPPNCVILVEPWTPDSNQALFFY